jgi:hypothetical protein
VFGAYGHTGRFVVDGARHNLLIENFLLHFRNLVEFFSQNTLPRALDLLKTPVRGILSLSGN